MEILATHLRPTPQPAGGVSRSDLGTLLQPGRVLAGVVLEVNATEALLGIGQHRVTAQASSGLTVGQQLVLRVVAEAGPGGVPLDVLGGVGAGQESGLLRMLRGLVGFDRPIGELLQEIGKRLGAQANSGTTAGTTAGTAAGAAAGTASGAAEKLAAHVFRPGADGSELRQLLMNAGLSYEAGLLNAANRGASREETQALLLDLKAELLSQLDKLPAGSLRESVSRALSALEAEQLLNVARREAGEPLHWSFPVPDGSQWTTAHFLWTVHRDPEGEAEGGQGDMQRVVVGVDFSKTGPVRIDALLRPGSVSVRLLVERTEVADRIRKDVDELREKLAIDGRSVSLVVGVASAEMVEVEAHAMDIRYLREHHLMDVSG